MPDAAVTGGLANRLQFERVATVLGIGAVLLPVAGYVARVVAFSTGLDVDMASAIARSAPIGQLAVAGFGAVLASVPYLFALAFTFRRQEVQAALEKTMPTVKRIDVDQERLEADTDQMVKDWEEVQTKARRGEVGPEGLAEFKRRLDAVAKRKDELKAAIASLFDSEEWKLLAEQPSHTGSPSRTPSRVQRIIRSLGQFLAIGSAILVLVALIIGPNFPLPWVSLIAAAFALAMPALVLPRWFSRSRVLGLLLSVAGVLLISAVGAGLGGSIGGEFLATFQFRPEVGIADGKYTQLGDDGNMIYLQPCNSRTVIGVNKAGIANVKSVSYQNLSLAPSLTEIVFGKKRPVFGYRPEC